MRRPLKFWLRAWLWLAVLVTAPFSRCQDGATLAAQDIDSTLPGDEWPQFGGTPARNNVRFGQNLPSHWSPPEFDVGAGEPKPGTGQNIRWVVRLGINTYGSPVVAGGKVFIGTANGGGWSRRFGDEVDLGCLLCFRASDGRFLWQYSSAKLPTGEANDSPFAGICSTPLVEGDRLWFVSNRCEVVCLDTDGFADGEDDGPVRDDQRHGDADVVWKFDMRDRLGVWPHGMSNCSVTSAGRLLFLCTSNGVDESLQNLPAPDAPSFICLDKTTGELLWKDSSPGGNVLNGRQWASPAYSVLHGAPQVIFAGGDGWLYGLGPEGFADGAAKRLWKFDCNPKASMRSPMVATPVIHDGLVYAAVGQNPVHGEQPGHLWCFDPKKRGDISAELVINKRMDGKPLAPRRLRGAVAEDGDEVTANPNSNTVWHYAGFDQDGDGELSFEETMHRTISTPVIAKNIIVVPDRSGLVHCLHARFGKLYWTHDVFAPIWASPLVVDDRVYVADEDGKVTIFCLSRKLEILHEIQMGESIYSTPIAAGGVLYLATRNHLFAIANEP